MARRSFCKEIFKFIMSVLLMSLFSDKWAIDGRRYLNPSVERFSSSILINGFVEERLSPLRYMHISKKSRILGLRQEKDKHSLAQFSQSPNSSDSMVVKTDEKNKRKKSDGRKSTIHHLFLEEDSPELIASRIQKKKEFQLKLKNKLLLAPLTKGGNYPFRKLCVDFGCDISVGEMAYARKVLKGDRKEKRLFVPTDNEKYFGVQIATNSIDEATVAIQYAKECGASFVDLNCGCPIYETTRRGLGAAMLKKPEKIAKLVKGMVKASDLPISVKIRTGTSDREVTAVKTAKAVVEAGAAAVTVHGRSMIQRYSKEADWKIILEVANEVDVPVIGNGDILTYYEAQRRLNYHNSSKVDALLSNVGIENRKENVPGKDINSRAITAVMTGRGALIKPWIFKEFKEGKTWNPTPEERVAIYWKLVSYFKERFGEDEVGRRGAFYFLPWHFNWFYRYRPLDPDLFEDVSKKYPLIQDSRKVDDILEASRSEKDSALSPLELLLREASETAHFDIATCLWDSVSVDDAIEKLNHLADTKLDFYQDENFSVKNPVSKSIRDKNDNSTDWNLINAIDGRNNTQAKMKGSRHREIDEIRG